MKSSFRGNSGEGGQGAIKAGKRIANSSGSKRMIGGIRGVHAITGCIFLCTLTNYIERTGFPIAFTELAKAEGLNETVKGTVLSAFYYGYAVMQLPGSWLSARYGGTRILGLSFVLWGVISLFTPGIDKDKTFFFLTSRALMGATQGLYIPASHTLLAQWVPVHERSRLVTLAMSGMYLGSALAMLTVPYMAHHFGPRSEFRISGLLALTWVLLWWRVGSDNPEEVGGGSLGEHPTQVDEALLEINKKEDPSPLLSRDYRHDTSSSIALKPNGRRSPPHSARTPSTVESERVGGAGTGHGGAVGGSGIPWIDLLQSSAVWAIVSNNFAFHYGTYVLMNWLPTYFQGHIGVPLNDLGSSYTVLPYAMMFLASNVGGSLGAWAHVSRGMSIVSSRKLVNTIGFSLTAVSLVFMTKARHWRSGVFHTTMALSALGLSRGGWAVNHMDVAPRHAGAVMAIANGAGTFAGVVGVAWTGKILEMFGGPEEDVAWSTALGVVAFVCLMAMVTFIVLARGVVLFH